MAKRFRGLLPVTMGLSLVLLSACGGGDDGEKPEGAGKLCVDRYVTAPPIDDLVAGLEEAVSAQSTDIELVVKNPEGDAAAEATIVEQFLNDDCDVIIALNTAAAQYAVNTTSEIPVVFAASTPVESDIVPDLEASGTNATGVALPINVEIAIDAMLEIDPDLKTVGLLYGSGDPVPEAVAPLAKAYLEEHGLDHVEVAPSNAREVLEATKSLTGKVDAIFLPGDSLVLASAPAITQAARDAGIPVFGATTAAVKAGGVLSQAWDYKQVGGMVGEQALKVLDGADPGTTPTILVQGDRLAINTTTLGELGYELPDAVRELVIEEFEL